MAPSNGVSALAWRDQEHCAGLLVHYPDRAMGAIRSRLSCAVAPPELRGRACESVENVSDKRERA